MCHVDFSLPIFHSSLQELFFSYAWNNFLHLEVEKTISTILSNNPTESEEGKTQHPLLVHVSTSQACLEESISFISYVVPWEKTIDCFSGYDFTDILVLKSCKVAQSSVLFLSDYFALIQGNLVKMRLGITKPSYRKVISLVQLFIHICFLPWKKPDITENFHGPKGLVITRFHCIDLMHMT